MSFIAIYDNYCGMGKTLEEAKEDLDYNQGPYDVAYCYFYEIGDPIEVEVKIVKKEVVTKNK